MKSKVLFVILINSLSAYSQEQQKVDSVKYVQVNCNAKKIELANNKIDTVKVQWAEIKKILVEQSKHK